MPVGGVNLLVVPNLVTQLARQENDNAKKIEKDKQEKQPKDKNVLIVSVWTVL